MSRARVSLTQRASLLAFMLSHPDFGRGRITGPDAARKKTALLQELAALLNASGLGATKTPEKWWKCWQDWRYDTKAKALKIKKYAAGTGGGPGPAPLSVLEQDLLQFCGPEIVDGVQGVPDPIELSEVLVSIDPTISSQDIIELHSESLNNEPDCTPEPEERSKSKKVDPMLACLERQAVAIERMAGAIEGMAAALRDLAIAFHGNQT